MYIRRRANVRSTTHGDGKEDGHQGYCRRVRSNVERVIGSGRSSKGYCLVPPVRGRIKRKIFALVLKTLKLATQHSSSY
ncbi:hypothetical protein D8674_025622 [Pyrus ussuriensis x Pyrus communis]|uniref:Uncharacterized protein n=1 Tax=Pyrus ussuriensis x Pyrus communis TaxID=2448454 RepID=A0A5N5I5M2_9ROSA|nr:hypothetical protein D8674_025622 [Pyrus ussuriensis x Pyrus communis]